MSSHQAPTYDLDELQEALTRAPVPPTTTAEAEADEGLLPAREIAWACVEGPRSTGQVDELLANGLARRLLSFTWSGECPTLTLIARASRKPAGEKAGLAVACRRLVEMCHADRCRRCKSVLDHLDSRPALASQLAELPPAGWVVLRTRPTSPDIRDDPDCPLRLDRQAGGLRVLAPERLDERQVLVVVPDRHPVVSIERLHRLGASDASSEATTSTLAWSETLEVHYHPDASRPLDEYEEVHLADRGAIVGHWVMTRPAGVRIVPVGSRSTAVMDPATLDVIDANGPLVGCDLGEGSERSASGAVRSYAAAHFALHADQRDPAGSLSLGDGPATALLLLQQAEALTAPGLDRVATAADRRRAAEVAEAAYDRLDQSDWARIGFALEELAAVEDGLGTLSVGRCRRLLAAIVDADREVTAGRLVRSAAAAAAALTKAVLSEADEARELQFINAPPDHAADGKDAQIAVAEAQALAVRAAVSERRGLSRSRRLWRQAERRWRSLDPEAADLCASRAASEADPDWLSFDAAVYVTGMLT